jgi:hypothetical protein
LCGSAAIVLDVGPDVHQVRADPAADQTAEPGHQGDQRGGDPRREDDREDDPDRGLVAAGTRRSVEGPGGERDGDEEQQAFDGPARRGRDDAGADRGLGDIPLTLEEPHPDREDGDVAADQRGEGVRGLQRDAAAERELAGGGAEQRPTLGDHRELGEQERQRHPSPAGALDGLQGIAGAGENADESPSCPAA